MEVCLGQLLQGELGDLEVIGGGVGTGVAGAKDAGRRLAGLGQVTGQGEEAEAALVGAGGALLLGVGTHERGVNIENQLLRSGARLPGPRQRVDRLDHPVGGVLRCNRPNRGSWPRKTPRSLT